MKITLEMIEAARRAEYDYYQRGRQIGAGRFIPIPDAVIRAMLEAALGDVPDPEEAGRPTEADLISRIVTGKRSGAELGKLKEAKRAKALMTPRPFREVTSAPRDARLQTLEVSCNRCDRRGRVWTPLAAPWRGGACVHKGLRCWTAETVVYLVGSCASSATVGRAIFGHSDEPSAAGDGGPLGELGREVRTLLSTYFSLPCPCDHFLHLS
jgi:hypothetical protein